jgi:hypothetical protein
LALSRFFSYPLFTLWRRFFGLLLSGTAGTAFYLVLAMIWVYCAWALYRLDRRGGWIALGVMILFRLSSVVTYSRYNLGDIYSAMGSFSGATGDDAAIRRPRRLHADVVDGDLLPAVPGLPDLYPEVFPNSVILGS